MKCTQQNGYNSLPKQNINYGGCDSKFNNLCFGVWCVTECGHHLMHIHIIHSHYPSWGLIVDKVWIFSAHGISMVLCKPFVSKLEVQII